MRTPLTHHLLVATQFGLSAVLVLSTQWSHTPAKGDVGDGLIVAGVIVATGGIAVCVWAWRTMGRERLRIYPTVGSAKRLGSSAADINLVRHGPYGWVRHPMYSGLLLAIAGLCSIDPRWWRLVGASILLGVLVAKSRIEERFLAESFQDYHDYARRTPAFIPRVGSLGSKG